MAEIDDFFKKATDTAERIGKARTARKQKQQEVTNLSTFAALNIDDRNSRTNESRAESTNRLGEGRLVLEQAALKLRGELGRGQLEIGRTQAKTGSRGADLNRDTFNRNQELFDRLNLFGGQDNQNSNSSVPASFRQSSDVGVLNSARELANSDRSSTLSNPKIQGVIGGARRRTSLKNTLENDLLSLR